MFHHVGLVVGSLNEVVPDGERTVDEIQKVAIAFRSIHGLPVEYLEPLGDDSPVMASLRKGQRLLHLCFSVPDLDAAIHEGRNRGFSCIARPVPATAFAGRRIAWLFSKTYGLIELVEQDD